MASYGTRTARIVSVILTWYVRHIHSHTWGYIITGLHRFHGNCFAVKVSIATTTFSDMFLRSLANYNSTHLNLTLKTRKNLVLYLDTGCLALLNVLMMF